MDIVKYVGGVEGSSYSGIRPLNRADPVIEANKTILK